MSATLLIPAMLLDAALGEPSWLWTRWPHPAVLMGRAVDRAEGWLNRGAALRTRGVLAIAILSLVAGGMGWAIAHLPDYGVLETLAAAILLAQRSLVQHVGDVASALRLSTADGQHAVARIVGRDTAALDGPAIARAAIESAAENLSDGVIAPAFWFLVAGLPGLAIYKIVNTADSMIGHRTPRFAQFGWAAARLDDVLNWIPARLTAAMIALSHGHLNPAPILRDAALHRSPNAGWPEAAMAVVLDLSLSGPRSYAGRMQSFPWVWPEGRRDAGPADIETSVRVLWRTWALALFAVACLAAL